MFYDVRLEKILPTKKYSSKKSLLTRQCKYLQAVHGTISPPVSVKYIAHLNPFGKLDISMKRRSYHYHFKNGNAFLPCIREIYSALLRKKKNEKN